MFAICGEALFDVFAQSETPTGLQLDARIGGSPFNVAVGLARLGCQAALVTRLSDGFLGARLMKSLVQEGVDTALIQRGPEPTTLSLVGLDGQGVPSYAFYGEGCADRALDARWIEAWPEQIRCIHVGSYATVVGITAQTQRLLIERECGRSLISYDPNVRLNVQPDVSVWRDQLDWMLPRTHLLKISAEDLHLLFEGQDPEAFAREAMAQGVRVVVVTLGEAGACAWTNQGAVSIPPVRVTVVDTVGAGDTFQAALLTWLQEHDRLSPEALSAMSPAELRSALGFAVQAASLTCARRGADLPRRSELPV